MKRIVFLLLGFSLIFIPGANAQQYEQKTDPQATVEINLADEDPSPAPAPSAEALTAPVENAGVGSETALDVPALPSGPASALAEAQQLVAAGEHQNAKEVLNPVLSSLQGEELDRGQDILAEINYKILFEDGNFPGLVEHKVKSGDSLYVIAKKYKTTPEFIALLNHLKGTTIFPDQNLRIVSSPYSIRVSKAKNRLELYLGDEILRTYRVATGTNNSTPVGSFTVTTKLENPTWYKTGAVISADSKENILGTRWLGFSLPGYGIHGTTIPESIGTQSTAGCVRMRNSEVEELYALVPLGSTVTIAD